MQDETALVEETFELNTPVKLPDGNQLLYLEIPLVYHPDSRFPKLTTPMWIGEAGIEAVIILSIDDLRNVDEFSGFLNTVFKGLDERKLPSIPMSLMSNHADPQHPLLQEWLKREITLEVHTTRHLCPLLQGYDLEGALHDVSSCLDNLYAIPGNTPLAFRMPCCDSQNSVSPRFFSEIFLRPTPKNHILRIDSSILCLLTPEDPEIPESWAADSDGKGLFEKYLPSNDFVNYIQNYPYPYVIHNTVWEFPAIVPSDWQGIVQADPEQVLEDWKRALDIVVKKKGVFVLCTHPKGPITQILDLVNYALTRHGRRVKFLNFKDAHARLLENLLGGTPLRSPHNKDHGVRLVDLNNDGHMDVVIANPDKRETRLWDPDSGAWSAASFPLPIVDEAGRPTGVRFVRVRKTGCVSILLKSENTQAFHDFDGASWGPSLPMESLFPDEAQSIFSIQKGRDRGLRVVDANQDGFSDLVYNNEKSNLVFFWRPDKQRWVKSAARLPKLSLITDKSGMDRGHRFADLNGDGFLDSLGSNEEEYVVALYQGEEKGWSETILYGKRRENLQDAVPPITENGVLMGVWFRGGVLYIQNERTGSRSKSSMRYDFSFLKSQR